MTQGSGEGLGSLSNSRTGVFFTPAALTALTNASATLNALSIQWPSDPYGWSGQSVSSGVMSVQLFDPDSGLEVPLSGADEPLLLQLSLPSTVDASLFACNFWDADTSSWSQQGTVVVSVSEDASSGSVFAVCGALHLTDFAGSTSASFISLNLVDPIGDASKLSRLLESRSLVVLIAVAMLLGVFVFTWSTSAALDSKLADTLEHLQRAHVLLYGEVSPGLGKEYLLTSAHIRDAVVKHNAVKRIQSAQERLQVRVSLLVGLCCRLAIVDIWCGLTFRQRKLVVAPLL